MYSRIVKIDEERKIRIVNNNKDIHLPFFFLLYIHPFFSFHFSSLLFFFFFWLFVYSRESVTRDGLVGTVPILNPWGLDGNLNTIPPRKEIRRWKTRDWETKNKEKEKEFVRTIKSCENREEKKGKTLWWQEVWGLDCRAKAKSKRTSLNKSYKQGGKKSSCIVNWRADLEISCRRENSNRIKTV